MPKKNKKQTAQPTKPTEPVPQPETPVEEAPKKEEVKVNNAQFLEEALAATEPEDLPEDDVPELVEAEDDDPVIEDYNEDNEHYESYQMM